MKRKSIVFLCLIFLINMLAACGSLAGDELEENIDYKEEVVKEQEKESGEIENPDETPQNLEEQIVEEVEEEIEEEISEAFDLLSFETTDLNGNIVTQDIFKDYDVTMINVWTTWCQYCIMEMPEIEEAYQNLPENANIITICVDGKAEGELARSLMEQTGTSFTVLVGCEDFGAPLYQYLVGYPTTFFVDSKGRAIGEEIVGVPRQDAAEAYLGYINERMGEIEK